MYWPVLFWSSRRTKTTHKHTGPTRPLFGLQAEKPRPDRGGGPDAVRLGLVCRFLPCKNLLLERVLRVWAQNPPTRSEGPDPPGSGHVLTKGSRAPSRDPRMAALRCPATRPDTQALSKGNPAVRGRILQSTPEGTRSRPRTGPAPTRQSMFRVFPGQGPGNRAKTVESRGEQKAGCPAFCDYLRVGTCRVRGWAGLSRPRTVGPRVVHVR